MSKIIQHKQQRIQNLEKYALGLIAGNEGTELLKKYNILDIDFVAEDILNLFDKLIEKVEDIEKIKIASNKIFNILYKTLKKQTINSYTKNSAINILIEDNLGAINLLSETKEYIKQINNQVNKETIIKIKNSFKKLNEFTQHYTVKENIIFPEIEKLWKNHQCLKVMWSFHDDIRKNIKKVINILNSNTFDLKLFNQISSKVYFNINTIIFREEFVLFPVMHKTFDENISKNMYAQLKEFKLLFVETKNIHKDIIEITANDKMIELSTGEISIAQIELIFKHLPVDMTFVDENNKVRFFSDPKHRIFPRTTGIIGRDVQNCHPHESVDIVNKIISSFKSGEKNLASFWLKMGEKYVLIQYFAIRDNSNNYKGILEVSQEISEIQKNKDERKLLDW